MAALWSVPTYSVGENIRHPNTAISQVPVNHEFGFREGRHTLFAPKPPSAAAATTASAAPASSNVPTNNRGEGGGEQSDHDAEAHLVPRPQRLPLEATLAFNPGQKAICVGLYETDLCAEDFSMVWLTVSCCFWLPCRLCTFFSRGMYYCCTLALTTCVYFSL